jgi:hypothetical protein
VKASQLEWAKKKDCETRRGRQHFDAPFDSTSLGIGHATVGTMHAESDGFPFLAMMASCEIIQRNTISEFPTDYLIYIICIMTICCVIRCYDAV